VPTSWYRPQSSTSPGCPDRRGVQTVSQVNRVTTGVQLWTQGASLTTIVPGGVKRTGQSIGTGGSCRLLKVAPSAAKDLDLLERRAQAEGFQI
jgi:hypothetical protein